MTTEKKIGYQSHVNKSFENCTLSNIDEIANTLYNRFDKSEEAIKYISLKYIKIKEALLNINNKPYTIQSEYKEGKSKKQLTKKDDVCERLNCLSY